ncbi:hypothetical protein [Asticcacaulis sp. YBE204]|uniref:hypothetical protein n=1 Tax=Asticcacaulis sp. YBE204 TaxID=1282363 RepID=UPI0003C3D0F8|nr:hypothetical protein [Asticcacaulis sp. YBE204]ESQ77966.1 hypothetical protein AEYBE204_15840 [Asticcacaulis sp. YBE204]
MTSQDTTVSNSDQAPEAEWDTQHGLRPLVNFLKQARNHYLDQFRSFVENQRKAGYAGEPEALLQTDDDTLFDRFLVADYLITSANPHVVRFEPSRMLSFSPMVVILNGMTVTIERLRWDDVVVISDVALPSKEALQVWFEDWTEPRGNPEDHHAPLANVLHSVRFEHGQFRIDFGSALPKALVDLFILLHESGARDVKLI